MKGFRILMAALLLAPLVPAQAGIYTDDLSRCLIEKTTVDDKTLLVQWIFVALAQHPSVASFSRITPEDVEKQNKAVAQLFMRLLTETCVDSSRKAMKYEGSLAMESSFKMLGQAAAREIFSHPDVGRMISGLDKYVDKKQLDSLAQ